MSVYVCLRSDVAVIEVQRVVNSDLCLADLLRFMMPDKIEIIQKVTGSSSVSKLVQI